MRMSPKLLPALLLPLALAGCESGDSDGGAAPEPSESPTQEASASTAGTPLTFGESGWLTVGSDGAVQTTFFDADGRYRDMRNGELLAQGAWQQRADGKLCFEPDTGLGDCWETGALDENGAAIATNGAGKRIEIKRVTYIAPETAE